MLAGSALTTVRWRSACLPPSAPLILGSSWPSRPIMPRRAVITEWVR